MPRVVKINSIDELRSVAARWDDLWERSEVTMPMARAELIAQWVEQFRPNNDFHAIIVEDRDRFLAALPLMKTRLYRVLSARTVPADGWIPAGGVLILDSEAATDDVLDLLVQGVADMPQQVLWLEGIALNAPRWNKCWHAINRARMTISFQEQYAAGLIEIDHDWQAYRASWSRWHRRNTVRRPRQLAAHGELRFEILSDLQPDEVETQLRRGFEVEDRSWKGKAGSSVFGRGQFPHFLRQASQLATWGQLRLAFLTLDKRPISFCYGFAAKGVYHTLKIGYDPEYSSFSPGQVMFCSLLERLFHDPQYCAVDTVGLLTSTMAHWRPRAYTIGIAMIAPRGTLGRFATYGHKHWWPYIRRLKTKLRRSDKSARNDKGQHDGKRTQ